MSAQVITQKSRGFICVNAHPEGCARNVENQIAQVERKIDPTVRSFQNVLVIGSSTGYGLSSRITAAWGMGASTLGVFLEKPPAGRRTATAGYYNSVALHRAAQRDGLWAKSLNGDAFSDEIREAASRIIQDSMGRIDLVVYSLASPKRTNPRTGRIFASSLKSIGKPFTGKTIDLSSNAVIQARIEAANEDEIENTIEVMGGEDWRWWIESLLDDNLLAEGARTLAYTYYGPSLTWPIYRDGTIGAAKQHLKETAGMLDEMLRSKLSGSAWLSVNKAVVTQASSAIPVVPLYISLLFKVMKERGIHEGCIEQMHRLFRNHLAAPDGPVTDQDHLIRLDDLEMREDVQQAVEELWPQVTTESLSELSDYEGFQKDFNQLFGFNVEGTDYNHEVETEVFLDS